MNLSKLIVVLVLLLELSGSLAHAEPVLEPGQSGAPGQRIVGGTTTAAADPFRIFFDEQGNGFYQIFNPTTGQYGPAVNDPGFIDPATGFLTYRLPQFVVPGPVLIMGGPDEPANSTINGFSDRIFFFDDATSGLMQYMSVREPGEVGAPPADVSTFPIDTTLFVNETGPEGNNSFVYPGSGDPSTTNFFIGTSDGVIPEPTSIILLATGMGLLAFGGWVQRHRARVDSRN